jgi:hypothetical protein
MMHIVIFKRVLNDTIKKLEELDVQIVKEDAPLGMFKNASIMLGAYRPIYFKERKNIFKNR